MLRDFQTAAADRSRFVQHQRIYRHPTKTSDPKDWTEAAFKWGLFAWLMGIIWSPVALVVLVLILALIG